jgi:hypothetical protein
MIKEVKSLNLMSQYINTKGNIFNIFYQIIIATDVVVDVLS